MATDIWLETATGTLSGTMLSPGRPAALIIAGSGPTDRDGNSKLNLRTNAYKMLAEGLAAEGICTLRYDKRGIGASRAALTEEHELRFQTYVDDARAWSHELAVRAAVPRVWLIGHSEGALIGAQVAHNNPEISGLISISGAGRRAGDILREQLASLPEPLRQQAVQGISQLESGRLIDSPPPQLLGLFRPSVQAYMISWLALDPAAIVASLTQPVFILQGDSDLQVTTQDANRLAAARPGIDLKILSGVNHVLKSAPLDHTANMATYNSPELPLAPSVVESVVGWIKGHLME